MALGLAAALLGVGGGPGSFQTLAAVWTEDFASDPAARGWAVHGEASLFEWSAVGGHLEATWDSGRTNSLFHHPLDTTLTKRDDFSLAFDLRLTEILGGARPGKPGPFEIAIGLLHRASATNASFTRGKLPLFPNLCEFDYFPQGSNPPPVGIIAATVSPMIASTNGGAVATSMNFPFELPLGEWLCVTMTYASSNRTLSTVLTRQGQPMGPIKQVALGDGFTDFRLDAFSITSYSDAGDRFGSVLARGQVDNVRVTTPDPPRPRLEAILANEGRRIRFVSDSNWVYALERSDDLRAWRPASAFTPGAGGALELADTNAFAGPAEFYRVAMQRR